MQIENGKVPFIVQPDDRPYIKFRRKLNKGMISRDERRDEQGKVTRAAHPGEFEEDWIKPLISHRSPFDPYTWATKDWALHRIEVGYEPIEFGNIDKLPPDYPAAWKQKVLDCIGAIATSVTANKGRLAAEARLAELEAKLAEQEKLLAEKVELKTEEAKVYETGVTKTKLR